MSDLSFLQKGKGKDLVFLHGFQSFKESFLGQIEYFSQRFRVTAFDFWGMGKSAKLTESLSVSDYADLTAQFLSAVGVKRPHIVAHSFGARVAVKLLSFGYEADRIVFTGPAGILFRRPLSYHIKVKTYRLVRKVAPNFAKLHFGSKEYRTLGEIERESYKKIVNEDLKGEIALLKNPYRIIQGKRDFTTPMKMAKAFLSLAPQGEIRTIEGGHFAFAEHPLTFNLLTEEFLA